MRKIYLFCLVACTVLLNACSSDDGMDDLLPGEGSVSVETLSVVPTSTESAIFMGHITAVLTTVTVLDHGFVYGPSTNWSDANTRRESLVSGAIVTAFQKEVTGLSNPASGKLYVAAYAVTGATGTIYGKALEFTLPSFNVKSITPMSGKAGDQITLSAEGIDLTKEKLEISFNSTKATVVSTQANQVVFTVPSGITLGTDLQATIRVVSGSISLKATESFKVIPSIKSFSPTTGGVGTIISFDAENIPVLASGMTAKFAGKTQTPYVEDNILKAVLPVVTDARVAIIFTLGDGTQITSPDVFTVAAPTIQTFSNTQGRASDNLTITGTNFWMPYGENTVTIGGKIAKVFDGDRKGTSITVQIPTDLAEGTYTITVSTALHTVTSTQTYTVLPPVITSFSPSSGTAGTVVTIKGNFDANTTATFDFYNAQTISLSPTELKVVVPDGPYSNAITLRVRAFGGSYAALQPFAHETLSITSINPTTAHAGDIITINGTGFSPDPTFNVVEITYAESEIISATPTQLKVKVPADAITGEEYAMEISVRTNRTTVVSKEKLIILE